jgi:CheY-like chemotaxis protein
MSLRAPSAPPARDSDSKQTLSGLNVLVVDDQEDARELMAVVLEGAGAHVTLAGSVPDALRAIAALGFGVLVSDIGMPGEDGYDLIRQLRASEDSRKSRPLPALAVTAFSAPEDRRKVLSSGFQEHLAKPVDWIVLLGVVERLRAREWLSRSMIAVEAPGWRGATKAHTAGM